MTEIQIIQVDSPAFKQILETVAREATITAERLLGKKVEAQEPAYVGPQEARKILGIGTTKLQKLRDNREIEFTDERRPRYKRSSLYEYLERKLKKK